MNEADTIRIEKLRTAAIEPAISYDEFYLHFYERYDVNSGTVKARIADAWAWAFDHVTPQIDDGELIVGKASRYLSDEERKRRDELYGKYSSEVWAGMGQDSHMAVDYDTLLRDGIVGIKTRINEKIKSSENPDAILFYKSALVCLDSVVRFSNRYAEYALAAADNADEIRREELLMIAERCKRVPEYPAQSFAEAVQSVHFISFCLSFSPQRPYSSQQFQLGHPDRYLYPYYKADIQKGILNNDKAQLLLDCLGIMINCRVPHGLSSGYMLGGRDRYGNIVANELTILGMQVIDDIRLVYPSVGLCYTKGMDEIYLTKACEILSHGRSHPAIFNDDIITEGLISYGVPSCDAHEYIHSTCVEITPAAASNVWVASPYTNMLGILLHVMDREYDSFDSLLSAVYSELDASIKRNFEEQNSYRLMRYEKGFNPLLSCFVNDCIELGVDIEQGGARYNWIMPSFVGMANLTDSLYVLKKLVFEKGEMTVAELKKATDANFEGYEALRQHLLNGYDKYGNNVDEVDLIFRSIVAHIVEECRKYTPMLRNARLIPSVFCWIMHEQFGRETGASPDGRLAGFPLGDGSGPCQGRELNGPTASVLSSTKWSHKELIGGVAVNMKFAKRTFTDESGAKVRALIHAYMERGGFEIQINVVDRETLLRARQHPDEYSDLVVRIGGYSDYFTRISPQMQDELLLRTEHEI